MFPYRNIMRTKFSVNAFLSAIFLAVVLCQNVAAGIISEQWMEVTAFGDKIGFAYRNVEELSDGYKVTTKTVMRLEVQGTTQDMSSSQTYFLNTTFQLQRFSYVQKMLNHRQFFDGKVENGKLKVEIRSGGNVSTKEVPFDKKTYLADTITLLLSRSGMQTGQNYNFKIFMISLMSTGNIGISVGKKTSVEINGKTEEAFIVTSHFKSFSVDSWVAPDGRVLKEESPMGFTSQAVDEMQAVSFDGGVMPFTNLLTFSLIPVDGDFSNPKTISRLEITMSGLAGKDLVPNDERQKTVVQKVENRGGKKTYTIGLEIEKKGINETSASPPLSEKEITAYLKPTFEAQADDPFIQQKAMEIVDNEEDAFKSAQLINRWVYKNVHKKFVDTFSAVETLRTMEGECQSHTNLFTALARSAGIPTRTVSGIVYSKQFEGFLYHAWPEVYVDKWIAMDPTFGEDIADATHIKLVEGDLSKQLQLFEFIGRIAIDVELIEKK